jgi:hypothetical protein
MASLDSLPPDQRAVIQLVLQRGRSYDQIAAMLGIERAAVRRRALEAFDALGPSNSIPAPQRALLTDYLLGQLPARVAEQLRERLAGSPPDRAWARVVSAEISELASGPLPEIPVGWTRSAQPGPAPVPGPDAEPADVGTAPGAGHPGGADEPIDTGEEESSYASRAPAERDPLVAAHEPPPPPTPERSSSRLGGAIVLAAIAIVIAVVVVLVLTLGGSSGGHKKKPPVTQPVGTTSTPTTTTTGTSSTATSTTATKAKLLAEIELTSPSGDKHTTGVAQVIQDGKITGIVIVADGVPANTKANAYAVWLYNSPTSSHLLGFVDASVARTGKLQTEGELPANARSYHELLVTLETQSAPKTPGKIVLQGPFSLS